MMTLLQIADASDYRMIASGLWAVAREFWWLPVLVGLFWYLRWYGKANRTEGVDNPTGMGFALWLKDVGRVGKKVGAALVGIVLFVLIWAGFVFDIAPTVFQGLAGGEPIVWAILAAAGTAAGAAGDFQWATPVNTLLVFLGSMAFFIALDKLGTMSARAADDADDALEGDDD